MKKKRQIFAGGFITLFFDERDCYFFGNNRISPKKLDIKADTRKIIGSSQGKDYVSILDKFSVLHIIDENGKDGKIKLSEKIEIKEICLNYTPSLFCISTTGKLYYLNNKELIEFSRMSSLKNIQVMENKKFKLVRCGWYHTIFVDEKNEIFSFGNNSFNQLGISDMHTNNQTIYKPNSKIKFDSDIVDFSCGSYHNVVLTSSGSVYTQGWNIRGQCANGTKTKIQKLYKKVKVFNQFKKNVSDSYESTYDNNPNIYVESFTFTPKICKISSGYYHNVFMDNRNRVFLSGYSDYGQLCVPFVKYFLRPTQITMENGFYNVECGCWNTFFHLNNGSIISCGFNSKFQLGIPKKTKKYGNNVISPTKIQNFRINIISEIQLFINRFAYCDCKISCNLVYL